MDLKDGHDRSPWAWTESRVSTQSHGTHTGHNSLVCSKCVFFFIYIFLQFFLLPEWQRVSWRVFYFSGYETFFNIQLWHRTPLPITRRRKMITLALIDCRVVFFSLVACQEKCCYYWPWSHDKCRAIKQDYSAECNQNAPCDSEESVQSWRIKNCVGAS